MSGEVIQYVYIALFVVVAWATLLLLGIVWHYERVIKLLARQISQLTESLDRAHAKMMSVDYEKFAELDIRARAEAAAAYTTLTKEVSVTDEFGQLIQEPQLKKVWDYYGDGSQGR